MYRKAKLFKRAKSCLEELKKGGGGWEEEKLGEISPPDYKTYQIAAVTKIV